MFSKSTNVEPLGPKFESTKIDGLYPILDGIAWLDTPTNAELAQFSGLDARTVGKVLKNAQHISLVEKIDDGYVLMTSYPFDGTLEEKSYVVKEALVRFPLLKSMRQFLLLGDDEEDALRKAATLCRYVPYDAKHFAPLLTWARKYDVLEGGVVTEDLLVRAQARKETRQAMPESKVVAFLSHSSSDKPFVRQLASDLDAAGVSVWLDEQRIKVGDSISESISHGLASSDFFLIVISEKSIESEWVRKELNSALLTEVQKRQVHILPLKLEDVEIPSLIADKRYADFSDSYRAGLSSLLAKLTENTDGK